MTSSTGYTVLARRYRSRDFDEIVGQDAISQTLQNAIATGRTAHAYLFCGTRGVGKTSMARIFAKALNVGEDLAEADEIGAAILRGDDLDVIEIDGASNRGINEARDLIANAGLSPARCRYRIYIIDEVHMLTREAFNALLKTMEEPPAHVKFILCTTDPQKVPATIQSRCQRFDFRPISTGAIARQLTHVLETEGIPADDAVVRKVAQLGRGSMRDALSLLDRLLAGIEDRLTLEHADALLGLADDELVDALVAAICAADVAATLSAGAALLGAGTTVEESLERLAEAFRTLMVVASCGAESELLELTDEARAAAKERATRFDVPALVHLIALCDAASRSARGAATARAIFDAAIVRACLIEQFAVIADVLDGGGGSKKKAGEVAPARPAPAAPRPKAAAPASKPAPSSKPAPASAVPSTGDPWKAALALAAERPSTAAMLDNYALQRVEDETVYLEPKGGWSPPGDRDKIAKLLREATGARWSVAVGARTETKETPATTADREQAAAHPTIRAAMDIFDATVTAVRPAAPKE